MADEAVLLIELAKPIPFTVADGLGMEKGSLVDMQDPMTCANIIAGSKGQILGGFIAGEKIASDGKITAGIYREGIFKVTGSGNITAGDPLTNADCATAGTPVNRVEKAATNTESILGTALESSTDGQTLKMEVRVVGMELA